MSEREFRRGNFLSRMSETMRSLAEAVGLSSGPCRSLCTIHLKEKKIVVKRAAV